ncbi:MAG: dsbD [Acidobacteria bacterium]|nr:dsbD [Acidobacteriota bacterium]
MRTVRLGFFLCALGVLCVESMPILAQSARPKATIVALTEHPSARAGESARVALRVSLPEGLHTQSNKPRDPLLIPTELTIDAPAGVTVKEIVWPRSTDLKQAGQDQPLAVFEQTFAIGGELAIASSVPAGRLVVPAHLRYQACDANLCYAPSTAQAEWTLEIVAAGKTANGAGDPIFATIAFGTGDAPVATAPAAPRAVAASSGDGIATLDQFTELGMNGGYLNADEFLRFVHNAENGVKERGMFEGRGPLMILLLVLIGGLALNLTPCVLPMIPINLAIIGAGAQAGSRSRGFLLGSAYGFAMALVYGAIGLVVILTAGTFGTINSSPWFNLGIAILFFVLALAMFDVLLIDFSQYAGTLGTSSSKGTFALAFSMGAVAALLAGACVAPVVIQVVLFSSNLYATGTKMALALPFCLGVGMAIPWPLAGAGLAALPKPGMWMVRVKQAFGVFIMATAIYYGYEAYSIFANRWVDPAAVESSVKNQLKAGWHASLAEGLDVAQREQKPVLIDMWATWCKNCLTMDKTTLENADVQKALAGYIKIKYQAEDPDQAPAKTVMQRFNAAGLPTYVILRPTK